MFPKKNRLAKDTDVKRVLATGRSFFTPHLSVKCLRSGLLVPRFTVVVSSKVSKLAVKRNRLKRIIRAELEVKIQDFRNGDFLFRVKPGAAMVDEGQIRSEVRLLINKAHLLK